MVLVDYLGKMIELTDAELEKIMKCPNLKYRTLSGYIVKGSDVRLNDDINYCHEGNMSLAYFLQCLKDCSGNKDPEYCKIDLNNTLSLDSEYIGYPIISNKISIYSSKQKGILNLSGVQLNLNKLDISGVAINMTNNSQLNIGYPIAPIAPTPGPACQGKYQLCGPDNPPCCTGLSCMLTQCL